MGEAFYFKINKVAEYRYGWILPNGVFFGCDKGCHCELSEKIIGHECYVGEGLTYGWVKIYEDDNGNICFECSGIITPEQKYKLFKYCNAWEIDFFEYFHY